MVQEAQYILLTDKGLQQYSTSHRRWGGGGKASHHMRLLYFNFTYIHAEIHERLFNNYFCTNNMV